MLKRDWDRWLGRILDMLAGAGLLALAVACMVFITDLTRK